MTKTGIMGESRNPAHVEIETYDAEYEAKKAMYEKFRAWIDTLSGQLEYCAYDNGCEARLFGELAVIVIAVAKIPDPHKKKAEVL